MKVLVTGAGALLGQGLIRSLRMSDLQPTVVAVDPSPLSAGLYWADSSYLVPLASDPNYMEAIETILEAERPQAVLIGTDVELEVFAAERLRLEKSWSLKVIVSSPPVVEIADDKFLTFQFLKRNGFAPPESRLPDSAMELVDLFGYPLVVKPRKGARSVGFAIVKTDQELNQALDSSDEMLVQEFLTEESGEFTAGTLTFEGSCGALIVMRRDLRDGNTYRAFTVRDSEINLQVKAMAEKYDAYGPANFQFRIENGLVRVFEINCRFSGTTPLRAMAGFNEVELALRHVLIGEPVTPLLVPDLAFLRHWEETVVPMDNLIQ